MRRARPRIILTFPEVLVVLALLAYGVGTLGFTVLGPMFFVWALLLALVASPFAAHAARRRRRQLARLRDARRRTRVSTYSEPWLEWEEAA